jgi:hypothetical protein
MYSFPRAGELEAEFQLSVDTRVGTGVGVGGQTALVRHLKEQDSNLKYRIY